jgi:hypothetical protein
MCKGLGGLRDFKDSIIASFVTGLQWSRLIGYVMLWRREEGEGGIVYK